jgi:hypothetical protein
LTFALVALEAYSTKMTSGFNTVFLKEGHYIHYKTIKLEAQAK